MAKYLFVYRAPNDHPPGEDVEAWKAWFEGMGADLADYGNPVFERTALGNCGAETELRGYSMVTADDLEAAVEVAKACPGLERGVGVEVGELAALD